MHKNWGYFTLTQKNYLPTENFACWDFPKQLEVFDLNEVHFLDKNTKYEMSFLNMLKIFIYQINAVLESLELFLIEKNIFLWLDTSYIHIHIQVI